MPRAALSQTEVDEFREALCASATRLFAEFGYEGVTMRALAKALGCSPMTPYRYFENKAAIFETVRLAAADRFAEAIDGAVKRHADDRDRLVAMAHAYVGFALDEPHAYRIIFELDRRRRPAAVTVEETRSWFIMKAAITEALEAGVLEGRTSSPTCSGAGCTESPRSSWRACSISGSISTPSSPPSSPANSTHVWRPAPSFPTRPMPFRAEEDPP